MGVRCSSRGFKCSTRASVIGSGVRGAGDSDMVVKGASDSGLQAIGSELQASGSELQASGSELQASGSELQASGSELTVEESAALATKALIWSGVIASAMATKAPIWLGVIKSAKLGITPPWSSCCVRPAASCSGKQV